MSVPGRRGSVTARRSVTLVAVFVVLLAAACRSDTERAESAAAPDGITVAAASDLRPAFEELADAFTAETGTPVTFVFGSSGQLREQVINGAPFDVFASANVAFVDDVIEAGRARAETRADYAYGRIVLWARPGGPLPGDIGDLADPAYRRVAIANPDHAPYGLAAQQALESAGVDDAVAGRLVYGENISDTFRIVGSGNADVGIVALSLAIANGGEYTLVPAHLHQPLRQALVVTAPPARAGPARRFAAFVSSPAGRAVMVRYGFVLPGEGGEGREGG